MDNALTRRAAVAGPLVVSTANWRSLTVATGEADQRVVYLTGSHSRTASTTVRARTPTPFRSVQQTALVSRGRWSSSDRDN
jgi:hypothetical protein